MRKRWTGGCSPATLANLRLDEQRVAELLDAATEVFIEHGFEGASTNEISKRANCSKTTLYCRYPTKQDLFIAVLERRMEAMFEEVFTSLPQESPLEETLIEFGSRVLKIALSEEKIRLERVVSMEAERFPELAAHFVEIGPMRGQEKLASYLKEQIKKGRLVKEDPSLMAEHLMSLITGGPVHWRVFGLGKCAMGKEQSRRLEAAVKTFLRAYATQPARPS